MKRRIGLGVLILAALTARTFYGLFINFNEGHTLYLQDYTQIYLIGLKFYTTGIWPYWGPDITYTGSQIPGALQGLLVGSPFFVLRLPEAPFLLLNMLSASALVFFAWYITKRIPGIPAWFAYAWLLTSPWTMNYSTTIINPSYLLAPSVLFLVSFIELLPVYNRKIIPAGLAWFLLGLTSGGIIQIHMSWVLLPFYILVALVFLFNTKDLQKILPGILLLAAGILAGTSTLIPTLLKFGLMTGNSASTIVFNPGNLKNIDIITRFIGFSTFDARQFIAGGVQGSKELLLDNLWAAPFILFGFVAGFFQTVFYLTFFFRKTTHPEFRQVRLIMAGTILMIYLSYAFAARELASYTFYLLLPVSFWFSFYCLENLFSTPAWRVTAVVFLLSGLVYHLALAKTYYPTNSLDSRRALIVRALESRDSRLFAYRRLPVWEKQQQEKFWEQRSVVHQGDTVLNYYNGFDGFDREILPEALNNSSFISHPYSCQVDSLHPFSFALTLLPGDLGKRRHVTVSLFRRYTETSACQLVTSITLYDKPVYWVGAPLCTNPANAGRWSDTTIMQKLPDTVDPSARISFYVWLPPSHTMPKVLLDDVAIEIK